MLKRYGIDTYTVLLIATVIAATLFPARGGGAPMAAELAYLSVALLFFLYGARQKFEVIWLGLTNLRLQGLMLGSTYLLFPALGLMLAWLLGGLLGPKLTTA